MRISERLPQNLARAEAILIYDKILLKKHSVWINQFPQRIGVKSGEALKDVMHFPKYISEVVRLSSGIPRSQLTIVVFGGGSVGDFGGFVASVLKRGVHLIQIPSTWLAAMDSAHGGKTALNVGQIKNQIGTFHLPQETYLVKEVLLKVPEQQVQQSLGEFYKTALIAGGGLWQQALRVLNPTAAILWRLLPKVVATKMRVVNKDPQEKTGHRHILNLGHTIGHVLESELGLAHGEAVHLGLRFSLNWGATLGYFKISDQMQDFLPSQKNLTQNLRRVRQPLKALLQDKKMSAKGTIQFVFVQRPGKAIVRKVSVKDLMKEWTRQCQL